MANGERLDRSNGYEAVAAEFMSRRSDIGTRTVRTWAGTLPQGATVLDLGCGHGVPISQALIEDGFVLYGIDASLRMAQAFRRRFPQAQVAHEAVEDSAFFGRTFDAAIAIGLMFLLPPVVQTTAVHRVASVLNHGGRFLFTSPEQPCGWVDVLTGQQSQSLGLQEYVSVALGAGFTLVGTEWDEGGNHYFDFLKQ